MTSDAAQGPDCGGDALHSIDVRAGVSATQNR